MQLGKKIGQVWQPRAPVALKYGGKLVGVLNSGTVSALVQTGAARCAVTVSTMLYAEKRPNDPTSALLARIGERLAKVHVRRQLLVKSSSVR